MTTSWFKEKNVATWQELYDHVEKTYLEKTHLEDKAQWVFRGQRCEAWKLKTGIERLCELFRVESDDLPDYEWKLVREFCRRAHIYHPSPPKVDDLLAWLALLRHHGGPTRLLDVTYSPFIAAFFALEDADKDAAVWAINATWLRDQAEDIVKRHIVDGDNVFQKFTDNRDGVSFKKMFMTNPPLRFVRVVNPMQLNERLTLQQGAFLCPGDIATSFEENLKAATEVKENVRKIIIGNECRIDALARLRKMNIDRTTLFPGLDGFAQSLNTRFKEIGDMPIGKEEDTRSSP